MSFLRRWFPPKAEPPARPLEAGRPAPDFNLPASTGGTLRLSDLRGQPIILAFYPEDETPVCGAQMALYNEVLPMFAEHGARLLGISADSLESHHAFASGLKLRFALLSDAEPRGAVATDYGVYRRAAGVAARALFVIDGDGIIAWSEVFPGRVNPGADGILGALESLSIRKKGSP